MKKKIYEGKAKIIYEGPKQDTFIQYFKDDATAFNNKKKSSIPGKGVINNFISELLMTRLSEINIPTHLIKRINMREQLVQLVEIIPVEFVVRNIAAGSLSKRLGIEEGTVLKYPLLEFYYKNDKLGDPLITKEHIHSFNYCSIKTLEFIEKQSLRINDFLQGMFKSVGIKLVDFKIEFGKKKTDGKIILADEISPDTCRLWDVTTEKKLDKDRFRRDLGNVIEAYQEVARRLNILHEQSNITPIKFTRPREVKIKKNR